MRRQFIDNIQNILFLCWPISTVLLNEVTVKLLTVTKPYDGLS